MEQFLLLAKSQKGPGLIALIKQVLETPGIYVFAELIDMPNVKELQSSSTPEHVKYYNLLELFAYGLYSDYAGDAAKYPALTPEMILKLRKLTLVSLAQKQKFIPYSRLCSELCLSNIRELEDLVIDAIYSNMLDGKLDQRPHGYLQVHSAMGRDVRPADVEFMAETLKNWSDTCESVLATVEEQIGRSNQLKIHNKEWNTKLNEEIESLKKTLRAVQDDQEMPLIVDTNRASVGVDKTLSQGPKKSPKVKGLRGSAAAGKGLKLT